MRFQPLIFLLLTLATASTSWADEEFSLVINPFTGAAELRNDGSETVELDGYFITASSDTALDVESWVSLQDSGASSGWSETFSATGNRLGELNLFESLPVPPSSGVAIGSPYTPFAPTALGEVEPGLDSLNFSYTLASESKALSGDVEFSSRNTVVLVVDPTTGESSLENQSGFDLELDGYLVKSTLNVLDAEGWTPIAASDADWTSAGGSSNRIAEANLLGASPLLPNGGSLSLGRPVAADLLNDESDLLLEFTTAGLPSSIAGGVLFRSGAAVVVGDCNGDGVVNAADLGCVVSADQRDAVLQQLDTVAGDLDGNQSVDFADFLVLSANFGDPTKTSYADGDIDLDGGPGFPDFLLLSGNFGSAAGDVAAVPEPIGIGLLVIGLFGFAAWRPRHRRH